MQLQGFPIDSHTFAWVRRMIKFKHHLKCLKQQKNWFWIKTFGEGAYIQDLIFMWIPFLCYLISTFVCMIIYRCTSTGGVCMASSCFVTVCHSLVMVLITLLHLPSSQADNKVLFVGSFLSAHSLRSSRGVTPMRLSNSAMGLSKPNTSDCPLRLQAWSLTFPAFTWKFLKNKSTSV